MVRQAIAEVHIVMANLIWKYNDLILSQPINLGSLEHLAETSEFEVLISHDSKLEITECGFYISSFTEDYIGSVSANKDYEKVLWLANNYPGYGLSIRQEYEVTGQFDAHDGIRVIDFEREERTDIFSEAIIEILSGDAVGETAIIDTYNPANQVFKLASDFSASVKDASYKISINKEDFIKTGQGSDYSSTIPLIYRGGVIVRNDEAKIFLKLRIPKFAQGAGNLLFDFNMQFTSLEEN